MSSRCPGTTVLYRLPALSVHLSQADIDFMSFLGGDMGPGLDCGFGPHTGWLSRCHMHMPVASRLIPNRNKCQEPVDADPATATDLFQGQKTPG